MAKETIDLAVFFRVCLAIFQHLYKNGLKQVVYKLFLFSIFLHINLLKRLTSDHQQRWITQNGFSIVLLNHWFLYFQSKQIMKTRKDFQEQSKFKSFHCIIIIVKYHFWSQFLTSGKKYQIWKILHCLSFFLFIFDTLFRK